LSALAQGDGIAWRPRASPWAIAVPVMLVVFMVVLDTSVVVVALPYIAGNLGATQDQSTWVLTSYLVSNAIILPASTWFSSFFGRKRFLVACTVIFTASSLLCGLATSMSMLVLSRVAQGVGGGAMQPLSQAILLESFPPDQRGTATALFGLGIVVAPIVGPTLGGWLTDQLSWRWTFYINLPVGIAAVILMLLVLEDPPYIRAARPRRIDGLGFGLMAIFLGALQLVLDKGQDADWFSAVWLRWVAVLSLACFVGFVVRELLADEPIVNLRVFTNRNFALSTALFAVFGLALYALIALQPLFLQSLLGYTAFDAGLSVTPRGLGAVVAISVVGVLVNRINPKILVAFGFAMLGLSSLLLSRLTLQIALTSIVIPNLISGFGTSCVFVPLTALAVDTLSNEQIGNAAGLQNLVRNVGGSIGLSYASTMLQRYAQVHQAMMVRHLSSLNPQYLQRFGLVQRLLEQRFTSADTFARARDLLYQLLLRQSSYWAFVDVFYVVACLCIVSVLCVPIFRRPAQQRAVAMSE